MIKNLFTFSLISFSLMTLIPHLAQAADRQQAKVSVGIAEADITPTIGDKPVYMAGFGQNRLAKGVLDQLMVRAIVFKEGDKKIALACIDVVGFFHPDVEKVRKKLDGFSYVLFSSTHNHEGPDT